MNVQELKTEKLDAIDMERLSPMMRQYVELKHAHPDCILFFRLGDFYEMFFDDATLVSKELEIALTSRDCGQEERAPMCGVPFHAVDSYLPKLIEKNYKVAICEQLEDPALTKGIVKRGIVRIVSPGTVTDSDSLEAGRNNYLLSIYARPPYYGLAAADISTGEFLCTMISNGAIEEKLCAELARYQASELISNERFMACEIPQRFLERRSIRCSTRPDAAFERGDFDHYLEAVAAQSPGKALWHEAAVALLGYLEECKVATADELRTPRYYSVERFMEMDAGCRRNLELTSNMREGKKHASLLWVLDHCKTAMGQRRLRSWIEQPLMNIADIRLRQEAVAELKEAYILRQELREAFSGMNDLGRLSAKLARRQVNARDLLALRRGLAKFPVIKELLNHCTSRYLNDLNQEINALRDLTARLEAAIDENAGISLSEGGLIREGFSPVIDDLREKANGGRRWILDLEERERSTTGIKNLKVGYNRVFGYYIEVSKSNLPAVPERYVRKQTLVSAERFVTEELKSMEDSILSSKQRLIQSEYTLFCELRDEACASIEAIRESAEAMARLDSVQSLAEAADRYHYVRPELDESLDIEISGGRHPVVERLLNEGEFVPNDCMLDASERRLMILTGPNMGGKSTYMRQNALLVLMAQIGSFIPADKARIGLVDRLFTRIGASDDLAGGSSTFMLEMQEMSHILHHAGRRSLLILDEVGRGTSTFDGLAIAWAIIEHIADEHGIAARTLFATHYHELTELESVIPGIFNAHVEVRRDQMELSFLHHIADGGADESYGIEVAALADIPRSVVERAGEILRILEEKNDKGKNRRFEGIRRNMPGEQNLFTAQVEYNRFNEIIDELCELNLEQMNFMDAANILYKLHERAKKLR